ncbi:hypothetical protein [Sphingorhabdus sp.]|jgi:hypothetical protein|uniref:hypothetical protein n=1 Tax=Sphingorhabdus sp. TaxID=1902408 RepID=UPI0035B28D4A|nr:hypothetical protein [Sphingomonadaceae bacterium]
MKMDFPHLLESNSTDRRRARFAELVTRAANWQISGEHGNHGHQAAAFAGAAGDSLQARIGFFGRDANGLRAVPAGAFLPDDEAECRVNAESERTVHLSASANGKPTELQSRCSENRTAMRGMEN